MRPDHSHPGPPGPYSSTHANSTPPTSKPASSSASSAGSKTLLNSINSKQNGVPATTTLKKRNSMLDSKTGKDGRRHSIFPWSNRKSSSSGSGAQTNNYYNSERLPVISDPVLEFSTADFFTSSETLPKARPVPIITAYPPSSHAISTRNSVIGLKEAARRPSGKISPHSSIPSVAEEKVNASVTSQIDQKIGEPHNESQGPISEKDTAPLSPKTSAAAGTDTANTETMADLRRKLRESEQKSIDVLIEYQQKIDKSRKRVLELERKLQEEQRHTRDMSSSGSTATSVIMVPSTPIDENFTTMRGERMSPPPTPSLPALPPGVAAASAIIKNPETHLKPQPSTVKPTLTPEQMQVRITTLEDQRDNLRLAIKSLYENKQLESKRYEEQIERMNRQSNLRQSLAWDPFMVRNPGGGPGQQSGLGSLVSSKHGRTDSKSGSLHHHHSHQPSFALSLPSSSVANDASRGHTEKPNHPSLDLSYVSGGDSSYSSPLSASSTGTINSVSSSSSSESTWTTASGAGAPGTSYQKHSTTTSVHRHHSHHHHSPAENGGPPRRIGIGPFLPLGSLPTDPTALRSSHLTQV